MVGQDGEFWAKPQRDWAVLGHSCSTEASQSLELDNMALPRVQNALVMHLITKTKVWKFKSTFVSGGCTLKDFVNFVWVHLDTRGYNPCWVRHVPSGKMLRPCPHTQRPLEVYRLQHWWERQRYYDSADARFFDDTEQRERTEHGHPPLIRKIFSHRIDCRNTNFGPESSSQNSPTNLETTNLPAV